MKLDVQAATEQDLLYIAQHMNNPNLLLVNPEELARKSILQSSHSWVWRVQGVPVCAWGVGHLVGIGGTAIPWLIATHDIVRYRFTFLKHCRSVIAAMASMYTALYGFVDVAANVRWIEWLGFKVLPETVEYAGHTFYKIEFKE